MAVPHIIGDAARSDRLVGEADFLKSLNCSTESIAKAVADGALFLEVAPEI